MLDMRPPADLDIGPCPGLPIRYVPRERAPLPLTRRPLRTTGQPIQRPTPDGAVWRNGTRVRSTHRPWDPPIRSSGMNEPQINVDHFYHRPIYHVVGLLTENSEIPAISKDLESGGVDLTAVEILCGEPGARILDEHGRYHGLRGRIVRTFQRLGYDETTLEIYDEALRKGDLLLQVPVIPAERRRMVALLQHHHVHDLGYFGPGTFEQFPILDAD